MSKTNSLLADLESLANPAPAHFGSDDDNDETDLTRAKVVENFDEIESDGDVNNSKTVYKRQRFLDEEDERYKGSVVDRSSFFIDEGDSDEEEEENGDDEIQHESNEDGSDDEEDVVVLESDADVDDDIDNDADRPVVTPKSKKDRSDENLDVETESTELVRPFSQFDLNEELSKARAVQVQLKLWEQLLAARIRLQRVLSFVNQLPQDGDVWASFTSASDAESSTQLTDCKNQIKSILDNLLHFQTGLLYKNPNTKFLIDENATVAAASTVDGDEEIFSSPDEDADDDDKKMDNDEEKEKRLTSKKLYKMADYPEILAKRHSSFKQYRDKILLHWYEKTRLSSGKVGGKHDFGALEKNIVKQIDQILLDRNRLIKRTQMKRSSYVVLGKRKRMDAESDEVDDEYDAEIFDDDDFYHQLLRELIERKSANVTDPSALTRQWLEMQKLRNKAKKKHVDRKASKGRKIRYDVLPKLVNFMASFDGSKFSSDAKDELYKSLFGQRWAIS